MKHLLITIIIILTLFSTNSILLAADKSQIEPKTAQDYVAEGIQKELKNDDDAAKKCYLKAIKEDPGYSEAYNKLCNLETREYGTALKYRLKAFEFKPNFENAFNIATEYHNASVGYGRASSFTKAIEYYLQALEFKPNDKRVMYYIGRCYYYKGDYKRAILHLKKAISIDLKNSEPSQFTDSLYKGLAKAYEKVGNTDEATIYSQKANEIDPNYIPIEKKIKILLDSLEAKSYILEDFSSGNLSEKNWINDSGHKWQIESKKKYKWDDNEYSFQKYSLNPPKIKNEFTSELFYVFKTDTTCFLSISQEGSFNTVECYIDNNLAPISSMGHIREYPLTKGSHTIRWKIDKKERSIRYFDIYEILVTTVRPPKVECEIFEYPFNEYFPLKAKIKFTAQNPSDTIYYRSTKSSGSENEFYDENIQSDDSKFIKYETPFFYEDYPRSLYAIAYRNGMASLFTRGQFRYYTRHRSNIFNETYPLSARVRSSGSDNFEFLADLSLFTVMRSFDFDVWVYTIIPSGWAVGVSNKGVVSGFVGYNFSIINLYYSYNSLGQNSFDMTVVVPLHHLSNENRIDLTGGYRYFDKENRFYIGLGLAL